LNVFLPFSWSWVRLFDIQYFGFELGTWGLVGGLTLDRLSRAVWMRERGRDVSSSAQVLLGFGMAFANSVFDIKVNRDLWPWP
jgi:hypothetical protein